MRNLVVTLYKKYRAWRLARLLGLTEFRIREALRCSSAKALDPEDFTHDCLEVVAGKSAQALFPETKRRAIAAHEKLSQKEVEEAETLDEARIACHRAPAFGAAWQDGFQKFRGLFELELASAGTYKELKQLYHMQLPGTEDLTAKVIQKMIEFNLRKETDN